MDRNVLIDRISSALQGDDRVRGAWLSGSLGRDTADSYSDVDVWIAVSGAAYEGFISDWPNMADSIAPIVLNERVGSLPVFNAITVDWLRFDVVVGTPDELSTRTRSTMKRLFDKDNLATRMRAAGDPLPPTLSWC